MNPINQFKSSFLSFQRIELIKKLIEVTSGKEILEIISKHIAKEKKLDFEHARKLSLHLKELKIERAKQENTLKSFKKCI